MNALSYLLVVVIGVTNCANSLQELKDENKRNIFMTVAADLANGQITIKRNFALERETMKDGQSDLWKKRFPTQEELMSLTTPQSRTHIFIPKISSTNGLEIQVLKIKPSENKPTNLSTSKLHNLANITDPQSKQIKLDNPLDVTEATEKIEVENNKGSTEEDEEDKTKRELEDTDGINILEDNKKNSNDFKNEKREDYLKSETKVNVNSNKNEIKISNNELEQKTKFSIKDDETASEFIDKKQILRNESASKQNKEVNGSKKNKENLKKIGAIENGKINENKSILKEDKKDSHPEHEASHDIENSKDEHEKSRGITKIMNQNRVIIQTALEAKPLEEILKKNKRISDQKKEEQDWKLLKELKESKINASEIDVEFRKQRKEKNATKINEPCKVFSFVLLERCPDIKKDPNAYNCRTVYVKNILNECTYFVCAPVQNRYFGSGSHMEPQLMFCPPGTYFSPKLLVCDYIDNASREIVCPVPGNNSTSPIS